MKTDNLGDAAMPLRLVILDLAGTVLDFGSCAPAAAFVELFAHHHITLSDAQARGPMGMHKRDHIAALCRLPDIREQWLGLHGRAPTQDDIQRLYAAFIPLQMKILPTHADLVPGARDAIEALRRLGLKIAFTTGYSRDMLDVLLPIMTRAGLTADTAVCGTDVTAGRPAPWMALECAQRLDIHPPRACLKFGDTIADIEAGRNAGMWSVGAAVSGNMVGLSLADWEALPEACRQAYRTAARDTMQKAGAHAVVDTIAELPALIDNHDHVAWKGGVANPTDALNAPVV